MLRSMLRSTIRRATVTAAGPDRVGSLTLDPDLMDAADLLPGERVSIVDVTSGARLETYVVAGERGSGVLGVTGVAPGGLVDVISYGLMDAAEAAAHRPRVIFVDAGNRPVSPSAGPVPQDLAEPDFPPAETADAAMLDALLQTES